MEEKKDMGIDEILEYARLNNMTMSYSDAKNLVEGGNVINNMEDVVREDETNPISEYESLSTKMRKKISEIIESLKEEEKEKSDDRDEKDNLDEKDGKEDLDEDKKKKVEEREKESKEGPEKSDDKESKDKEKNEKEKELDKYDKDKNKEETPKKDQYLAKITRLHVMKLVDYKDQMKHDDPRKDKYFMTMIALQRDINRERNAFIKVYGKEELEMLENKYLKEEQKYRKTLNIMMERDLVKLRQLDEKLDSILDRMQTLRKGLEDKNISLEEYNDEINALEKDKLDTLWEINKLNPELLQEKQENMKDRKDFERRVSPENAQKRKDMTDENKAREKAIDYNEKKQDGMSEKYNEAIKNNMQGEIDEMEKRLDELRKEASGLDINSEYGWKKLLEISAEIQTLETQKMDIEIQWSSVEKNMYSNVKDYGELEIPEARRKDMTDEIQKSSDEIEKVSSNDLPESMKRELQDGIAHDPSNPEEAKEFIESIQETKKEAIDEAEKEEKEEQMDDYAPSLFNRNRRLH